MACLATPEIRTGTLEEAFTVYRQLPEFYDNLSLDGIRERAGQHHICLVAELDGAIAGFKLGYPRDPGEFYSWIGGVLPRFRRSGLAQRLLECQEQFVRERGYAVLRVKSMNRFPGMLHLLIANGYQVEAVTPAEDPAFTKVHFAKSL